MTLVVEAPAAGKSAAGAAEKLSVRVERMQAESRIDEKEALKRLAKETGRSKSELYRELQRERARR
jgi:16S rRNA (cytidine1402-2'-O)-methyltransferase